MKESQTMPQIDTPLLLKGKALLLGTCLSYFPSWVLRFCPSPLALFGPPYWSELELAMELGNSKILEDQEDHLDSEIDMNRSRHRHIAETRCTRQ